MSTPTFQSTSSIDSRCQTRRLACVGASLVLALTLLTTGWAAADQPVSSPLATWKVIAAGDATESAGVVTLPANGQMVRSFDATQVSVRLVSRPFFSPAPAGLPSIEVGPAILSFVRDPSGGALVLLGDEALPLPFVIELAEDGRSRQPIDFILAYDQTRQAATLQLNSQIFTQAATGASGPVEVAITTGTDAPWILEQLEVRTVGENPALPPQTTAATTSGSSPADGRTTTPNRPAEDDRGAARRNAAANAKKLFAENSDETAERTLTDTNRNPKNSPEWHLESANRLVQTAFSLTRLGRPDKAVDIARRALQHAEQAARKTSQPALAATADATAAFIHERLLADAAAAKLAYASALRRNPQSGATRDLARLERIEAEAARKSPPAGK